VNSNSERLLNHLSTRRALLGSPVGSYFPIPSPGVFSLEFEYREEHSSRGIGNRLEKMSVFDHAPVHSHKQEYNISPVECQLNKSREEEAAIPLTAKAISPLAAESYGTQANPN